MQDNLNPGVKPHEVWAWAMYDFANSGYTTVVVTAIFSAYFVSVICENRPWATFAWTAALALSNILVMLTAQRIGAHADAHGTKKRLLFLTTLGCVSFTAALALPGPGNWWLAMGLVVCANVFFGTGENLIAAFLPELARPHAMGRVSGWGWSLGYVGGLLSLGLCLAYVQWAQAQGQTAAEYVPVTLLITAALFALASLPTFLFLRERPQGVTAQPSGPVPACTLHLARLPDLRRFLWCVVAYQAGIATVISLAAIYVDQVLGLSTRDTLVLIVVVNITASLGAVLFGHVEDRLGHVTTLALVLCGWIIMVGLIWWARGPMLLWIAGNLAGLCMGASQSAGRAIVGLLAPSTHLAECFGLWGLAVKASAILGPVTYGLIHWLSGGDHRLAMLVSSAYFVLGLAALLGIDLERGRKAAAMNA